MIVMGEAPLGRGCALACAPCSSAGPAAASAGPAAASAAPARRTLRRSISLSSAVGWLTISPSMERIGAALSGRQGLKPAVGPRSRKPVHAHRTRPVHDAGDHSASPGGPTFIASFRWLKEMGFVEDVTYRVPLNEGQYARLQHRRTI